MLSRGTRLSANRSQFAARAVLRTSRDTRLGGKLHPALELAQHHGPDHQHAGFAVVEAGNRREILAAMAFEDMRILDRDLLQRLQADRRKIPA